MRKQIVMAIIATLIVVLLAGCGKTPELNAQALAPGVRQEVVDDETYLVFDLGSLPKGVAVQAEGFDLKQGRDKAVGLYQLKLCDVLRAQNTDNADSFTVTLNLVYDYKGRTLKEVPVAYGVSTSTHLRIHHSSETTTTNDIWTLTGAVAPGAVVKVNGVQVEQETPNVFFCTVPLPRIGANEIVVTAERPGEAANTVTLTVNRTELLGTTELKTSIAEVTGGIAIDNAGDERPVTAVALQSLLLEVFAAPVTSRPESDTGGSGVGFVTIQLHGKQTRLSVTLDYVVLNDVFYKLPEEIHEQVTRWFAVCDAPYEWQFTRWREVLPFEVPQGLGVRTLAMRDDFHNGAPDTLLVVYEEKDDAAVAIDRIVEVSPGKFEVHVKQGSTLGRYDAVVIHGWDEQRQFTVVRHP